MIGETKATVSGAPTFLRNRINGAVYPYHPAIERLPHIEPFFGPPVPTAPDYEPPVPTVERPAAWQAPPPPDGVSAAAPANASAPEVVSVTTPVAAPAPGPGPAPALFAGVDIPPVSLGSFDGGDA
jgi:hypothetical protein